MRAHMVVLHDAEDMVDQAALPLLDYAVWDSDFVQLPVMALPPSDSRWVASHYSDEFAESHAKGMAVRELLGASIPGAGVGCAIRRGMLDRLAGEMQGRPFPEGSLTEDYEIGLRVGAMGGNGKFLRLRTTQGRLIATRAYFPDEIAQAVRQKTRWVHGIALQGWDRLGWHGSFAQRWMTLRDRRGPLAAILLTIAYVLVALATLGHLASDAGLIDPFTPSPVLSGLLLVTFAGLTWRLGLRAVFTAREYGLRQGLLAIPRTLVSNVIAIMSGRRALAAYIRTLRGAPVTWEKTEHRAHPAPQAKEQVA
jgi:adsorption protein B